MKKILSLFASVLLVGVSAQARMLICQFEIEQNKFAEFPLEHTFVGRVKLNTAAIDAGDSQQTLQAHQSYRLTLNGIAGKLKLKASAKFDPAEKMPFFDISTEFIPEGSSQPGLVHLQGQGYPSVEAGSGFEQFAQIQKLHGYGEGGTLACRYHSDHDQSWLNYLGL